MRLQSIRTELSVVRSRVRALYTMNGAGRLLITLGLFVMITFVLDRLLRVPMGARLVFLLAGVGALSLIASRFLVYPLTRSLCDDDLALYIEERYPQLQDRLISAIQFERLPPGYEHFNSPELMREVMVEAEKESNSVKFSSIIAASGPVKGFALGLALLAIIGLYGSFHPDEARIYLNRILLGSAQWPKRTQLRVQHEEETRVAIGDEFVIRVAVEPPESADSVEVVLEEEDRRQVSTMQRDVRSGRPGEFLFKLPRVRASFSFQVSGGDDRSDWYRVLALPAPAVERIWHFYTPPAYTGLAPTPADKPEMGGKLEALAGTRARIIALVSVPLSRATLVERRGSARVEHPVRFRPLPTGGTEVAGEVVVLADGEYSLHLTSRDGIESRGPATYPIVALLDHPPAIRVRRPRHSAMRVVPNAEVPMRLVTSDDFGLASLALRFRLRRQAETGAWDRREFGPVENDLAYPAREITTAFDPGLCLESLQVQPGDRIEYYFEATDTRRARVPRPTSCFPVGLSLREGPFPNVTRTTPLRRLDVVRREDLVRLLEQEIGDIRDKLVQVEEAVRGDSLRIARIRGEFGAREELTPAQRREILETSTRQNRVTDRVKTLQERLSYVIEDIQVNKLEEKLGLNRLQGVERQVRIVAETLSPQASNLLGRAALSNCGRERDTTLGQALDQEELILGALREALKLLEEWESFREVVRKVEQMIERIQRWRQTIKGRPR